MPARGASAVRDPRRFSPACPICLAAARRRDVDDNATITAVGIGYCCLARLGAGSNGATGIWPDWAKCGDGGAERADFRGNRDGRLVLIFYKPLEA
jgi:hypothetical protein